ncbi:hypothetical protein FQN50_008554 [Emmonsiellopsis sp. PD_5]|nr:hypothetical protein FQN50_008554 [Emmonsiellopsis sp. PD_5]
MLSQFVTVARGLFARQDPALEDASSHSPEQEAQTQQQTPASNNKGSASKRQSKTASNMVSATRRTVFGADSAVDSSPVIRSAAVGGKRKMGSSKAELDSQAPKRRKKRASNAASLPASGDEEEQESRAVKKLPIRTVDTPEKVQNGQLDSPVSEGKDSEQVAESNAKSTHVRFGSEEPEAEVNGEHREEIPPVEEAPKEIQETEFEDSDDEAPETVDNAAQLRKLKEAAKKEELAKQRAQALHKEKRRERDQRLKSQAASKPPVLTKVIPDTLPKPDEIRSESSTTLQGSTTTREPNFSSLRSLPTLLPDEILNAEPSVRPPTPPYESEPSVLGKLSQKRKFLDRVEKKPKDIRVGGGTAIRVLDSPHNNGLGASKLPPKASKASRKVRENWMASNRNLASGGSLRRTTGGSSGFLRK